MQDVPHLNIRTWSSGVGSTIGAGIYVLVGTVAREHTGPGLTLSFLIAGVAAALSALCYAELSCRFPSAGSAYHYSYICIGERYLCKCTLASVSCYFPLSALLGSWTRASIILSIPHFSLCSSSWQTPANYAQCCLADWVGLDPWVHHWGIISGTWHVAKLGNSIYHIKLSIRRSELFMTRSPISFFRLYFSVAKISCRSF